MDLRRRIIIRLDRLGDRVQQHAPAFFKGGLAGSLDRILARAAGKAEFMRFMDSFQAELYRQIVNQYNDEAFSQLFTLKLCNLAVSKYHFLNRHAVLTSKPYQLTIDPINACQLACPGCVHTANDAYAGGFDWPNSAMPVALHDNFLEQAGVFSFCAVLYNYGEPLLHKRFCDFVRAAKKYLLFTMTSTNLSMPLNDPESFVTSGLDRMVLSIDGATQDVYEKYRRKGQLELVFENVRKLVAAKRKLGSATPYLIWQFLTFEHNAHQVSDAIAKARQLGVNEILIQTPFDVSIDDPGIRPATVPERGSHIFTRWNGQWCSPAQRSGVADIAGKIETLFRQSWQDRMRETCDGEEVSMPHSGTCDWLYQNVTIDGAGRIMPCCMAPDKDEKHLVWTTFDSHDRDIVNPPMARLARLAFANRGLYDETVRYLPDKSRPFCAKCKEKPEPYGLVNVAGDIRGLDEKLAVSRSLRRTLTNWN